MGLDARRVDLLQKALERVQVKNALRLHEACACLYLLAELVDLEENRLVDRGDGCALIELRRAACDLVAAAVAVFLLHFAQHMQNADRIEVVHRLCVLAVADDGMVARERKNGVNAEAGRGQNVCHNGHAVAVAAGHLQDRLHASVFKRDAKAEGGRLQRRGLHIRDVHGVNLRGKQPAGFQLLGKIIALRGRHLGSHAELTVFECFF